MKDSLFGFLSQYSKKADRAFLMIMVLAICENTIFIYPIAYVRHSSMALGNIILPITYTVLFLNALSYKGAKNVRAIDFLFTIFLCISVAVSVMIHPEIEKYVSKMLEPQLLPCIPFFFLGICYSIDDISYKTIASWVCIGVLLTATYEFFIKKSNTLEDAYDMGASYVLLTSTLIAIDHAFATKNKLSIMASLVGVCYAFATGTRGPIVIIGVFLGIQLLQIVNMKSRHKIRNSLVIISIIAGILKAYELFLLPVISLFSGAGLSTRALDYLAGGDFISYTSGRDEIYETLIAKLSDNPFVGFGFFAEWPLGFFSAHNMYIELAFHYGYIVAAVVIITYIVTIIKGYKYANNLTRRWIILWACSVFIRGFFGGMYFSLEVFFLLGLSLQSIRNKYNEKTLHC